jgi:hypothetical protein
MVKKKRRGGNLDEELMEELFMAEIQRSRRRLSGKSHSYIENRPGVVFDISICRGK